MLYLDWGWEKGFPEEMLKDGSKEMFQSSAEDSIPEGTVFAKLLEKGIGVSRKSSSFLTPWGS